MTVHTLSQLVPSANITAGQEAEEVMDDGTQSPREAFSNNDAGR